ncbi:MAG: hypothetical protein A4S09_06300 [Proteobacteria bacterium SG_bin7]|nr:MAG: hypothetical protein A4S09_06300 [Proteobacteria bacterium SG_bin7]
MTASDLIEALKKIDPSTHVLVQGYEGGFSEIADIKKLKIKLDVNTESWYGRHEEADDGGVEAIVLVREQRV